MNKKEADTCRLYIEPKLDKSGWDKNSIEEQYFFTDGKVKWQGDKIIRGKKKFADYLLRYRRDFPIAIVEAKAESDSPGVGMQQAKDYAQILGLKFAYATNGHDILEFDFTTGIEQTVAAFPSPEELFNRLQKSEGIEPDVVDTLLSPYYHATDFSPRYYQQIAINRAVQSVVKGDKRVLITMATGTGKTVVGFQICWKLWSTRWNRKGEYRKPRILFLADRNVLVDDPKDKTFAPFGDARFKIEGGKITKSREMYFAIYQAIAKDKTRPGLYKEFSRDFFDLIIVDECHRGSSRDDSNWREILEYFEPAYQIGMTATPLREDNRDTYAYFGSPIYTYSLKQGIDDGFLAPYRVHRVITSADAAGWRPSKGELDQHGREIPDEEYQTADFERVVALRNRTRAIAKHLTDFMKRSNERFAKTIVFCVDQEHADQMRRELNNLNADLVKNYPDYVARVTSDEKSVGKGHLNKFMELETDTPVILTTSQLLTTGVDAPTCKNVVLVRVINSMTEFKQIIGRGTRLREDYGKLWFNIIDYTGSATRNFADPDFDGNPEVEDEISIDNEGNIQDEEETSIDDTTRDNEQSQDDGTDQETSNQNGPPRKFVVDGGFIEIASHLVYELDADGKQLRVVQYTEFTAEKVRTIFTSADELVKRWANPVEREEVITQLEESGISFEELARVTGKKDADPLDLLCHIVYETPLRTRRERAEYLRRNKPDFFDTYGPQAREILNALLDKYTDFGLNQFEIPNALQLKPISDYGNIIEIAALFGDAGKMKSAVDEMQTLLYEMSEEKTISVGEANK